MKAPTMKVSWRHLNMGEVKTITTSSFACPQCKEALANPDALIFNLHLQKCNNCGCVYVCWY